MPVSLNTSVISGATGAAQLAKQWFALLAAGNASSSRSAMPGLGDARSCAALAGVIALAQENRMSLLVVVPDDDWLPEISNAIELDLRPLCLVLPEAGFAAAVTLRATLSLLKSRLSREVEPRWQPAWARQREMIGEKASLWQAALDWCVTGNSYVHSSAAWPERIDALFPVLILPYSQALKLLPEGSTRRDGMVLINVVDGVGALSALAGQTLLLIEPGLSAGRALARVDPARRLKAEMELLAQELGEMELEFATAQAELAEFTRRYHDVVGRHLAELDALQAKIAKHLARRAPENPDVQQKAQQAHARAEQSQQESQRFEELDRQHEKTFAPSGDIKRLFRQLAQKIHPDRAEDEADRAWRTGLMSEANRAYRAGDEMVLRDIFSQWQEGRPDAAGEYRMAGEGAGQPPARATDEVGQLERQVERLQRRIAQISEQLNRLLASRLYELFAAANLARGRGRDLLKEMAEQLSLQIEAAQARLSALEDEENEGEGPDRDRDRDRL